MILELTDLASFFNPDGTVVPCARIDDCVVNGGDIEDHSKIPQGLVRFVNDKCNTTFRCVSIYCPREGDCGVYRVTLKCGDRTAEGVGSHWGESVLNAIQILNTTI